MGAVWVQMPDSVAVRVLAVRALSRIREELEREVGSEWGTVELEAGALLRDVCDAMGLTGKQIRAVMGDASL